MVVISGIEYRWGGRRGWVRVWDGSGPVPFNDDCLFLEAEAFPRPADEDSSCTTEDAVKGEECDDVDREISEAPDLRSEHVP